MTAATAKFILALPMGFLDSANLKTLVELDRMCPVLVRCGGGRFTCAAQDVAHFVSIVDKSTDYIRDVAVTAQAIDEARKMPQPKCPEWCLNGPGPTKTAPAPVKVEFKPRRLQLPPHFNEADCGGVFDGFQVTSDADPGL